jgi:hypothetical protein
MINRKCFTLAGWGMQFSKECRVVNNNSIKIAKPWANKKEGKGGT